MTLHRFLPLLAAFLFPFHGFCASAAQQDETITVHGLPRNALAQEVEQIFFVNHARQLSVWRSRICPKVIGIPDQFAQIVTQHIRDLETRYVPEQDGACGIENVLILFTDDGRKAMEQTLAKDPYLGHGYDSRGINKEDFDLPSDDEIAALMRNRAVRWYRDVSTEKDYGAITSFLSQPTFVRTTFQVVIVDINKSAGANWGQLADYLAFIVLANPNANDGFPNNTIMASYRADRYNADSPKTLTPFDEAILDGLYKSDPGEASRDALASVSKKAYADLTRAH